MARRSPGPARRIGTVAVLVAAALHYAGAQIAEGGRFLTGLYAESSLALPLAGGEALRPGGAFSLGLETVGFPAATWRLDLSADYRALPESTESSRAYAGIELRGGLAFPLSRLLDLAPSLGLAYSTSLGSSASRLSVGARLALELHLGSLGYASLSPSLSYPLGSGGEPLLGLSLGFKRLGSWGGRSSVMAGSPPPEAPPESAAPVSPAPVQETPAAARSATSPYYSPEEGLGLSLAVSPSLFSPDGDGVDDTLRILPRIDRPGAVRSWELKIEDSGQRVVIARRGEGAPPAAILWDGISDAGELVDSASDFRVSLAATDEAGRSYAASSTFATDVLVIKEGPRFKIRLPDILFPANSARLDRATDENFLRQNYQLLDRLAAILKRFPGYRITIEGHANLINWDNPAKAAIEEREVTGPLSLKRAEAVKDALVSLGIEAERVRVVGRGGLDPIVPNGDTANAYKNRRVEIFLDR